MKIAIISDLHLGFAAHSERDKDSFLQAKAAFELALKESPDFFLLPGDLFDDSEPSPEAMHDCFEILGLTKNAKPFVTAEIFERSGESKSLELQSLPVFAIHGTHEFRGKDHKNIIEACKKAGLLYYLHAAKAVIKKGNETICIFGLGGVPEKFALSALQQWQPKPESSAFNVLALHQSIKEFLPTDDEMHATIGLEDLPAGFQLIVNGHLHWSNEKQLRNSLLLMPGSTVTTQMKNLESSKPKGFLLFDTETKKTEFKEIPGQRKLFYERLRLENASAEEVKATVRKKLSEFSELKLPLKPMVRLKLVGSLAKGVAASDLELGKIEKEFSSQLILSLDQDFNLAALKKKVEELRALQKDKASISTLGLDILEKKLSETRFNNAFDVRRVFSLLSDGETEKAIALLSNEEKKD